MKHLFVVPASAGLFLVRSSGFSRAVRIEPTRTSMDLLDLARHHIAAENQHDLEKTMETIGDAGAEYKVYATGEEFNSREDIRKFYAETYWAFPDMRVEIQNLIQDASRRQAFLQYRFEATFTRPT